MQVRRVVTGHDEQGRAILMSDGVAPFVHANPLHPGFSSTDIWRTSQTPAPIVAQPQEPTLGPRRQLPAKGGTVLRINCIPPDPEAVDAMTAEDSARMFDALGNREGATFGRGGRHPLMHRTETVDYAIVLSGEVTLILDDQDVHLKAGDVVVQCGTNHAWSNRSTAPCTIAFILIDGQFDPTLTR